MSWESLAAAAVAWSAPPPAPAPSTTTAPVASFDVTAGEVARRVIDTAGDKLLIVDDGDYGTGYLVDGRGIYELHIYGAPVGRAHGLRATNGSLEEVSI